MIIRFKLLIGFLLLTWHCNAQGTYSADPQRMEDMIMELAQYGATPEGGVHRPGFGNADIEARKYLIKKMEALGLQVRIDAAGNILGFRPGEEDDLPIIAFGSHIDSVPYGGKYDGNVGVVAALECIQLMNENKITTKHPLEVMVFVAEEDGLFGSKGITGKLTETELNFVGNSGKSVRQGIIDVGGNPNNLAAAKIQPGALKTFLEVHIEQGAILHNQGINIGVVEGIVGIEEWGITIEGKANHSGTTPMNLRKDALIAASKIVLAVNELTTQVEGAQVATVGEFKVEPNVSNIVPGKVQLVLEMRDVDTQKVLGIYQNIEQRIKEIAQETKTKVEIVHQLSNVPAFADASVQTIIEEAAKDLNFTYKYMPSGAGHDAQDMAVITPIGMIFVPSKDGVSHAPDEFTSAQDMANGASVLLQTILKLDKQK